MVEVSAVLILLACVSAANTLAVRLFLYDRRRLLPIWSEVGWKIVLGLLLLAQAVLIGIAVVQQSPGVQTGFMDMARNMFQDPLAGSVLFIFWSVVLVATAFALAAYIVYPEVRLRRLGRLPLMPFVFYSLSALHLFAGVMATAFYLQRAL